MEAATSILQQLMKPFCSLNLTNLSVSCRLITDAFSKEHLQVQVMENLM